MLRASIDVQAHFKLVARTSDGSERNLTDWFPNLVLDSGLDRMSQGAWFTGVAVGTGNSEPLVTNVGLDALLASTTTVIEVGSSRQLDALPYYYSLVTVFRFAQGVAAGNISEIAMTWGGNNCWNRALIKDINGNPTTITVLPNEFLDVYTELRIYPKMTDTVTTVDLLNAKGRVESTHTVTVRANMSVNLPNQAQQHYRAGGEKVKIADQVNMRVGSLRIIDGSGALNPIRTEPTGSNLIILAGKESSDAYPSLRSCTYKLNLLITEANGEHKIIAAKTRLGDWKLEYDPPISKNNTRTLEHNFMLTWGRYEPT